MKLHDYYSSSSAVCMRFIRNASNTCYLKIDLKATLCFPMATVHCCKLSDLKWIFSHLIYSILFVRWGTSKPQFICLILSPWKRSTRNETALWLLARKIMKSSLSAVICHTAKPCFKHYFYSLYIYHSITLESICVDQDKWCRVTKL